MSLLLTMQSLKINNHHVSSFRKFLFSKCFPSTIKHKAGIFKFIHFEVRFRKVPIFVNNLLGLVRTVGLTIQRNLAYTCKAALKVAGTSFPRMGSWTISMRDSFSKRDIWRSWETQSKYGYTGLSSWIFFTCVKRNSHLPEAVSTQDQLQLIQMI